MHNHQLLFSHSHLCVYLTDFFFPPLLSTWTFKKKNRDANRKNSFGQAEGRSSTEGESLLIISLISHICLHVSFYMYLHLDLPICFGFRMPIWISIYICNRASLWPSFGLFPVNLLHFFSLCYLIYIAFDVIQAWEAATKAVKDEEEMKQKLCEDLNHLVRNLYRSNVVEYTALTNWFWHCFLLGSRKQQHSVF